MMLEHLRHTLIPLSAGLLFFSCSSDEPAMSGSEMKFDISSVSRSAVTTASNITERPFAIFGDMIHSQLAENPSARIVVYNNTPVTYINSAWTTPAPQYWYNNHEHSFVAIHPASVLSIAEANTQYSNSQLSFTYTLPSDHTQIADMLVATHRRKYSDQREYDKEGNLTGGSAEVVYLRFGHMMSQINLAPAFNDNIKDKDDYIRFHKLELSGFKSKATFRNTPASLMTASQTDDKVTEIDVTGQEANGRLVIEFTDSKKIVNDRKHVNLFDDDDAIIMIPQNFEADSDAKIILSYSINDETLINQVSIPLIGQEWVSGKRYSYSFTINRTGLALGSTTITDWDVTNVGNIDAH